MQCFGSNLDGTGVVFADWDVQLVINGTANERKHFRLHLTNSDKKAQAHLPKMKGFCDVKLTNELAKQLGTLVTAAVRKLPNYMPAYRIHKEGLVVTTFKWESEQFRVPVEFDVLPVLRTADGEALLLPSLHKTSNNKQSAHILSNAENFKGLLQLARALKLVLKAAPRGDGGAFGGRNPLPSCIMLVLLTNMIGRDPSAWDRLQFHQLFQQVVADLVAALEKNDNTVKSLATGKNLLETFHEGKDEQLKDDIRTWLRQVWKFDAAQLLAELTSLKDQWESRFAW